MAKKHKAGRPKKHKGGRPPKYSSPAIMQEKIDRYFATCIKEKQPPTVTGLAMALDMSRQDLVNYGRRDKFFATIKKAKGRIEQFLELKLYGGIVAGVIFNLKNNYGWQDKRETEIMGPKGGPVLIKVIFDEKENGGEKEKNGGSPSSETAPEAE